MPDFFVPVDTSMYSKYYFNLHDKGMIYRFAFYFSDSNRKTLQKFKTYQNLVKYLNKENVLEKFLTYAEKHGVKRNYQDLKVSSELLQSQLEAYIARNFFDNDGFYPIINSTDNSIQKAIEIFEGKESTNKNKT